jgi:cyclophilin family peptidyl-prolyl cis-trans isomerase
MNQIIIKILLISFLLQLPIFLIPKVLVADSLPFAVPKQEDLNKFKSAVIQTNKGNLYFELFPEEAPIHVANFKFCADKGLYRSTTFSHYFENYIIQGGRSLSLKNRSKYSLPPEFTAREHLRGSLGMARWEDALNRERRSNSKEFHILLADAKHMNGSYTVFGILLKGWSVLDSLKKGDTILDVKVFVRR